ncbi:MAG: membrane protein insertion efficiency factor YidD [Clostridiales bacterium]|jgi:putative membrane protein insertion efficiency factor|nr:membrane protein insertion efficiency factor YidD [Clostridiales bacterium]
MKLVLLFLIKLYKKFISPLLLSDCRFYPSCSAYASECVQKHGALKGSLFAAWRILRCNHFSKGGFDPVPDNFKGDIKWVL